jgi:hypothetical protein
VSRIEQRGAVAFSGAALAAVVILLIIEMHRQERRQPAG